MTTSFNCFCFAFEKSCCLVLNVTASAANAVKSSSEFITVQCSICEQIYPESEIKINLSCFIINFLNAI